MSKIRLILILASSLFLVLPATSVGAETSPGIVISEIQTGSSVSANEEFIELYNNGLETIDLSNYKIEYYASSATSFVSPFRTITLTGSIQPGAYYLLASTDYLPDKADTHFTKFIAATGGNLRLISSDVITGSVTQHDLLAWGTGTLAEGSKTIAPGDGKSASRKPAVHGLQDTDNNINDFEVLQTPTPSTGLPMPIVDPPATETPIVETPPADPTTEPPIEEVVPPVEQPAPEPSPIPEPIATIALLPIQITELFPNPESPLTDDADEFVELYNPNDTLVDLTGYVLKTGANLTYQQPLLGQSIGPKTYLVLYSRDSDLVLSNTTGRAVLFDPVGISISSTDTYIDAPEGQSWSLANGAWQWTSSPTPQAENIVILPAIKLTASTSSIAKPKITKKATTTAKVAGAKTATAKKASAPKATKAKSTSNQSNPASIIENTPLHPVVLGTVGLLALLYGLYEYRADIRNQIIKLRRNRGARS